MAAGNLAVDPVMQLATIGVSGGRAVGRMASACACDCPDAGHRIIGGVHVGCARSQGRTWRFDDTDHIHRGCGHSV